MTTPSKDLEYIAHLQQLGEQAREAQDDAEIRAALPPSLLGDALWPPERIAALRRTVRVIAAHVRAAGLDSEAIGWALLDLATAGSIPQGPLLVAYQQALREQ
jgi:hypothetical protein